MSDSEEGALPVGVRGGVPSRSVPCFGSFASVSEPDDLLWRRGYFLAAAFAAPSWLRVILRPELKMEAATGASAAGLLTATGELLRTPLSCELRLRRRDARVRRVLLRLRATSAGSACSRSAEKSESSVPSELLPAVRFLRGIFKGVAYRFLLKCTPQCEDRLSGMSM